MEKLLIRKEVLEDIFEFCKSVYPREFIGLLEGEGNTVEKLIVLPASTFGEAFSSYNKMFLPLGIATIGTVHSHPGSSNRPSRADLKHFSHAGRFHIIVARPYDIKSMGAYNSGGTPIQVEVVE